jgi:hypothetical protein
MLVVRLLFSSRVSSSGRPKQLPPSPHWLLREKASLFRSSHWLPHHILPSYWSSSRVDSFSVTGKENRQIKVSV